MTDSCKSLAELILSVQPMTGQTGQIFTMKPRYYTSRDITYRYLESSDQHIFNISTYGAQDQVVEWCTEMFGPPGKIDDGTKQWCYNSLLNITIFKKEEADWFILKWVTK